MKYKGWFYNPKSGRYARVGCVAVWLTPTILYKLDLENMKVWIRDVGELLILDCPRNLSLYKTWEIREGRLVLRDGMAEGLQKKYNKRWEENERILNRIRHFHRRTRNVLEDSAKKIGE
ncbi:hypothetical protein SUSAZ_10885 [Sulfolobus acidocaldarius SUSAZ]|nr:hypothetical protein SUSAZ_10885 [Sulfolobus acidocaldarius SUSAZ]